MSDKQTTRDPRDRRRRIDGEVVSSTLMLDADMKRWMEDYAVETRGTLSGIVRAALIDYRAAVEAGTRPTNGRRGRR